MDRPDKEDEMTYEDAMARMKQLVDDLAPLEVPWEVWEWGRFPFDGIQHVRRDGSAVVVTDDSDLDGNTDRWLVGFYTADQFGAVDLHEHATYVYCDSTADLMLTIIEQGQATQ
jgi:hypothetical protein